MAAPLIRRFTRAAPGALNVFAFATDDITGLTFIRLARANMLQDLINSPNPAAGLNYNIALTSDGIQTGQNFFSEQLAETSAGRIAVGPIDLLPGNKGFSVSQTLGALTAYSFAAKFAGRPG